MTKQDFLLRVRAAVAPDEYEKNKHLLDVISVEHYQDYMNCLYSGAAMVPAFSALDKIIRLSKQLHIGTDEVLATLPTFRAVATILDGK